MEHPKYKTPCLHCGQEHEEDTDNRASFATDMAEHFTERAFPMIWADVKEDARDESKRNLKDDVLYWSNTNVSDIHKDNGSRK